MAAIRDGGAGPIGSLINNAGFASYGPFAGTELEHELRMIAVNAAALTHLTKLVLPGMIAVAMTGSSTSARPRRSCRGR